MRAMLMIAAVGIATAAAVADDNQDRERRVRVALALAAADPPAAADACGKCREDVAAARTDGLKEGRPIVLFVGGCPGGQYADAAVAGGAIPVKSDSYTGDGRPPAERRTVILEPKADRSGFVRVDVPPGTPPAELREKVRASVPPKAETKPAAPLNWQF